MLSLYRETLSNQTCCPILLVARHVMDSKRGEQIRLRMKYVADCNTADIVFSKKMPLPSIQPLFLQERVVIPCLSGECELQIIRGKYFSSDGLDCIIGLMCSNIITHGKD